MPRLVIDNHEVEVPEGLKVIEAAEQIGIYIPRFCFYAELGAVGACRVCAVNVTEGPHTGIQMSCMLNVADGMVVSTNDAEAEDFRKHVIEWLMMNHPHDCPVCDEGGHCLLQDLTVACGHGIRRYKGKKRTYRDQYLGPLVEHEMNRCIQCYRCSRYYQQYTGYTDLGVMGIARRIYFGRRQDGVLQSPFSGNLIDICPTGVYTDKPSRYTGRRWDYRRSPGICIHCSLGCHTTVSERYRQIVRMEGRHSDHVNGPFICDRGRYGFYYANRSDRPRKGLVDGKPVSASKAAENAAARLSEITGKKGAAAVGVVCGGRSSLQAQAVISYLCRQQGWQGPAFWDRKLSADNVKTAVSNLTPEIAVSMRQIHLADFILAVGADPVNEAPMLTLAMRQAWREGAQVAAIDCRPLDWPFSFDQLACRPDEMAEMLDRIISKISRPDPSPTAQENRAAPVIEALKKAEWPAVVCGTETTDPAAVAKAAELTRVLQENNKPAGLFYILPQANSFGAALLDPNGDTAGDMVQKIENGTVSALVVVESDLWKQFPDRLRLEKALAKLDVLVTADFVDTEMVRRADIVIPTQTLFEAGGIYVNQEGRAQQAASVFFGGLSIEITGKGDHPPRTFGPAIPGADIEPAWQAAWRLAGREPLAARQQMLDWMMESYPVLAPLKDLADEGVRLPVLQNRPPDARAEADQVPDGALEILFTAATFGDESLSRYSECLQSFSKPAELWISAPDAEGLHIAEGDTVEIPLSQSPVELTARISDQVAAGVLVIYRQPGLFWQQFADGGRFFIDKAKLGYPENSKY